ncbi:MAG: hypothetical protein J7M26_10140 [Armatimonadetes bacterium]|nr:hypothetical protein [Armatimonadota bacterium]
MARRRLPIATVKLHQPGRRYQVQKAAWSFYEDVGALWKQGELALLTQTAGDLEVADGEPARELALAGYCQETNLLYCTPFYPLDISWPSTPTDWWWLSDGLDASMGNLTELAGQGVQCQNPGQISSKFTVGRDCWWSLVFWREEAEDDSDYGEQALGSEIIWGYDGTQGWGISWPRGTKPKLMYFADGQWWEAKWTDGSPSLAREHGSGSIIAVTIGVLRGQIVVFDLLSGAIGLFQRSKSAWETAIASDIAIRNFWGQWFVEFVPVTMVAAEVRGYVPTARTQDWTDLYRTYLGGYGAGADGTKLPVSSDVPWLPDVHGEPAWDSVMSDGDVAMAVRPDPPNRVEWRVRMLPYAHQSDWEANGSNFSMATYATPAFAAFGIWQDAVLQDNGEPAVQQDLTSAGLVEEIEAEQPEHRGAVQVTLRLHNRNGEAKDIGDFQQVTVERVGWLRKGASGDEEEVVQDFEKLLTLEPSLEGAHAEVPLLDLLAYLGLQKFDQGLPRMDGWNVKDAVQWVLEAYGIGPEQYDLEDTGVVLTAGTWEKPAWQPERGRSALDFLRELVEKGSKHGAIWCENGVIKTGCRYCRSKRTAEDWQSHCDNGWTSSGCLAADIARSGNPDGVDVELYARPAGESFDPDDVGIVVALARYTARIDSQDYANYVSVQGKTADGETLGVVRYEDDDLYQHGWLIPRVETDGALTTQAAVNARAQDLINELGQKAVFVRGTVLWEPALRPGRVVRLHGAERLGVNNQKFRVVSASHSIRRGRPYTTFVGRQIS